MRNLKVSKTFRNFLVSYVIILFIPLITAIIAYHASIEIAETKSLESSLLVLNQSKTHLEQRLSEVEKFSRQLATNSHISVVLSENQPKDMANTYQYGRISRELLNNIQANEFLEDAYIYLQKDEVIIQPGSVFYRIFDFYNLYHFQDISSEDWKTNILEGVYHREILPLQKYENRNHETSVVTYLQSIPLDSFSSSFGMIVIPIEQSKISQLFTGISEQYNGWAYITNEQGDPIAYVGTDEEFIEKLDLENENNNGKTHYYIDDTLIFSTTSHNGWVYYAGIPKETLMKDANSIKRLAIIVTTLTLLFGLIVSLFLAYRNHRPLQSLIGLLREESIASNSSYNNEFDFLRGNISSLIANNQTLQAELNEQLPMLREAFIKQLIRGDFYSEKEVRTAASQVHLQLKEIAGYVGIIGIKGYGNMEGDKVYEEISAARMIIKRVLTNIEPNLLLCYHGRDKIVVIFPTSKDEHTNRMDNIIAELQEKISDTYRISLNMFIGDYFTSYLEINRSYTEALRTMEHAELMNLDGVHRYVDIEKEGELYEYPIEIEMRLANHLKKGEYANAKEVLDQIFELNFVEKNLPLDMGYLLIDELKATLIKVLEPNIVRNQRELEKLRNTILAIQLKNSYTKVKNEILAIIKTYCTFVEKWQAETDHELVNTITQFLEAHFSDSNLTLYVVAENIGRPENYISHFFREKTGSSIMAYLENLRMEKATELLVNTDETITNIAEKVGYNSSHSFRRAFKRVMNMTPNVYRKINKK